MPRIPLHLPGLLAICVAAFASPAPAQSLAEAVRQALARNPEVLAAAANVRATEGQIQQARSGYFPTLDLNASSGRENVDNPGLRAQGLGDRSLNRDDASVTVRQMLFDGFQTSQRTTQQEQRLVAAQSRLSEAMDDVASRTVDAYMETLRTGELLDLARNNERAHLVTLEKTQQRVQQKVGSQADVFQSEARLAVARSAIVQREGGVRDAEARIVRLLGHPPRGAGRSTSGPRLPATQAQAVEEAINNHPSVKAAAADFDAATAAIEAARGAYYPRVDLELTRAQRNNTDGLTGRSDEATAMFVMRYNAFRGGADQAQVKELTERREAAREGLENTRRAIAESVVRAWVALDSARGALQYLSRHVSSTVEVLRAYRAQFELGRRSLLDVLNAENELYQAQSNLANGEYAIIVGEYRLLAAMGSLAVYFEGK